jgi:hypothetical protein
MIQYKVDEDLNNYMEIYNWIKALGFPDNYRQYKTLADQPKTSGEGLVSDISLIMFSNARIPTYEVLFRDAFPVSTSSLIFDTTRSDVEFLEASATFRYTSFSIKSVNDPTISN